VLLASIALGGVGCTSAQIAKDEATLNTGLVKANAALTWAVGHESELLAGISDAAALDPTNKTLQAGAAKAKALVASGDLTAAQTVFAGVIAVTKPVAGVTVTTAAGP
jgi:hypothetical protein